MIAFGSFFQIFQEKDIAQIRKQTLSQYSLGNQKVLLNCKKKPNKNKLTIRVERDSLDERH